MEDIKNIGIFVAANPAQPIELKRTMGHVGKESSEFEAANVERDANLAQLLLNDGDHQPRVFVGGRLHRNVEAYTVD